MEEHTKLRVPLRELGESPRVWKQVPGYVVRNCSPDLIESVVHHMITYFSFVEAFCSNGKLALDPISLEEAANRWKEMLKQNLTLIVLPENSPGADCKPITEKIIPLAGVNVLMLCVKGQPPLMPPAHQLKGKSLVRILELYEKISNTLDCFDKYDVEIYMDSAGLSVHPEHEGKRLGEVLLRARFQMCETLGVEVSKAVFSAAAAQKMAPRCDMHLVNEVAFKDIRDKHGRAAFPDAAPADKVQLWVWLQRQQVNSCHPSSLQSP